MIPHINLADVKKVSNRLVYNPQLGLCEQAQGSLGGVFVDEGIV